MKKKYKGLLLIILLFTVWIGSFIGYKNYISKQLINQQIVIISKEYDNNHDIINELVEEPTNEDLQHGKEILDSKFYGQDILDYFATNSTISNLWIIAMIGVWGILLYIGIKLYGYNQRKDIMYQIDRIISGNYKKKQTNDEMDIELNLLDTILKQKDQRYYEVKGQMKSFIEDVSHQIKTPLTALKINVDLNADHNNQKHIQRIDFIVSELIQLAKLEAHSQRFNFESNSLEECIDAVLEDIEFYSELEINTDIEECVFTFDLLWLSEAILNIVKNAMEYSNEYVGIKTKVIGDRVFIEIKDDGKEINEEEANHLFDRFYTQKDSRKQNGMGIGLNISYEVIKAHFGKIYAYSKDGYTYFVIELPIVQGKEKI